MDLALFIWHRHLQPAWSPMLASHAANAIQHMHELGMLHRDLKPGNMLIKIGMPLILKVADFGMAHHSEEDSSKTPGSLVASSPFRAPEGFRSAMGGGQAYDKPFDMWALGCVFFEMATFSRFLENKKKTKNKSLQISVCD